MKYQFINEYSHESFNTFHIDVHTREMIETYMKLGSFQFLFHGPNYSGKSSLIHIIKTLYYEDVPNKNDYILTISNLFDNGIQYFKTTLKTFCKTNITNTTKHKTIIIDDIDLLSENIQHVLRNYIDNYKNKINFITSCNNQQKVIESLQSRFVMLNMRPLTNEQMLSVLDDINTKEKLGFTKKHLKYIINRNTNNIKACMNIMQKLSFMYETYTDDIIKQHSTNINQEYIENYITFIKDKQLEKSCNILAHIYEKGFSNHDILHAIYEYIKNNNCFPPETSYKIIRSICKYVNQCYTMLNTKIMLYFFSHDIYNEASSI